MTKTLMQLGGDNKVQTVQAVPKPKPHHCPTCPKSFSSKHLLVQHSRVHTGEKPYECKLCERRFKQLSHLQQHTRLHLGERPYKCHIPECGRAFIQLSNLQQHLRSHESPAEALKNRPFRCDICGKGFATESSLITHSAKHQQQSMVGVPKPNNNPDAPGAPAKMPASNKNKRDRATGVGGERPTHNLQHHPNHHQPLNLHHQHHLIHHHIPQHFLSQPLFPQNLLPQHPLPQQHLSQHPQPHHRPTEVKMEQRAAPWMAASSQPASLVTWEEFSAFCFVLAMKTRHDACTNECDPYEFCFIIDVFYGPYCIIDGFTVKKTYFGPQNDKRKWECKLLLVNKTYGV